MERKTIYLTSEKELRTYMHPLRQRILLTLGRTPDGMTAKQLADALGIAPSSAGHHLSVLEEIGLVELARTEQVHGFTAKFYKVIDVNISLSQLPPEAEATRRLILQNQVNDNFNHWADKVEEFDASGIPRTPEAGEISTGMLYLSKEDAILLHKQFRDFCNTHSQPQKGTSPYEFTWFSVRTGEEV
jgi:DNA-binding transcriptional ArsR family regulator